MCKRLLQAICFFTVEPIIYFITHLPYYWLYKLSDILFVLFYYIIRYRRKVVKKNLYNAFSTKGPAELKKITKDYYGHLCDLLVEHIKSLKITPSDLQRKGKLVDGHVLQDLFQQKQTILIVSGHFGNWEWAANAVVLASNYKILATYKPLHNTYFDQLVLSLRQRFGREVVTPQALLRTIIQCKEKTVAIALLTDQAVRGHHSYTTNFLNQETTFFQGAAKLAHKFNYPVVYMHTQRMKRGVYHFKPVLLFRNPKNVPINTISEAHIRALEKNICEQPALWLWSHKRWE